MNVWIAEWGTIGFSRSEIIGVYEEEVDAKYAATAKLDEEEMRETRGAPVQGNYTWVDNDKWASITGYWTE